MSYDMPLHSLCDEYTNNYVMNTEESGCCTGPYLEGSGTCMRTISYKISKDQTDDDWKTEFAYEIGRAHV